MFIQKKVDIIRSIVYSILLAFALLVYILFSHLTSKPPEPLTESIPAITKSEGQVRGEELYLDRCNSCHRPIHTIRFEGPRMDGIFERLPDEEFFKLFIQNSDSLKKAGNGYARQLDHDNDVDYEHSFKDLSNQDIADLTEYIKTP